MKKLLIVILSLLTLIPIRAQITHASQGQLDENAAAVLKKATSRFDNNVGFSVTATMLDGNKKQLAKHTASVLYDKGRYRLTLPGQEVICDGSAVWQWNKDAKEVSVSNMADDEINLLNPARLLANYQKSFKAKYIRTDPDGTAVIDLTPRAARSYHKIRLLVKEDDGLLRRIEVHKYDSGREIYEISGFKKLSTPAASFTFDPAKHPGVEIIDMR